MRKVAIIQSNYIPWKGYFDIIHDVDIFVFLDDVQYTTRDWRNRNLIKTPHGLKWLTIPVNATRNSKIYEVKIADKEWAKTHWRTIQHCYARTTFFNQYKNFFEDFYLKKEWIYLSELNQTLIKEIAQKLLNIKTIFYDSREIPTEGKKQDKLLSILKYLKADIYISGPSAINYLKPDDFIKEGIKLIYKDYNGYPQYPQLFGNFEHNVSIIDTIFNTGEKAPYYIWGWRNDIKED